MAGVSCLGTEAAGRIRGRLTSGNRYLHRTDAEAAAFHIQELDPGIFEGAAQLGRGRPMDVVAAAFKISYRAARYIRTLREIALRPIQKTPCGAAQSRG